MTPQERGHKGGISTRDKFPTVCPTCGHLLKSAFHQENGQKGGEATKKNHDHSFYQKIGALGGRGNKRERKEV